MRLIITGSENYLLQWISIDKVQFNSVTFKYTLSFSDLNIQLVINNW
jgi:hypothetical protein